MSVGAGVPEITLARALNVSYIDMLGVLITPTIPALQWDTGRTAAQKNQIGALTLVITRAHDGMGAVALVPIPAIPLSNPPRRGVQGASKLDCVTVWNSPAN